MDFFLKNDVQKLSRPFTVFHTLEELRYSQNTYPNTVSSLHCMHGYLMLLGVKTFILEKKIFQSFIVVHIVFR